MVKIIIIKSKEVGDKFEKCPDTMTKDELIRLILKDILIDCGFNPRLTGFKYLIDSVAFCCNDKSLLIGKTKALYYKVAKHNNTTRIGAERNIRTLISDVCGNCGFDMLYERLNFPDIQRQRKLSNGMLIDILTEYFDDIL